MLAVASSNQSGSFPLSSGASHHMPAIPASVLEKIRRGEFVNFDLLLPNNVPSETRDAFTLSLNSSDISQGPKIVVRNGNQSNKNKVIDLHSWFLAWCLFFQAYILFRPHLAYQLAKYQIFIAQLASNYNFSAWYAYDQAFRLHIANNPLASWDLCNEDIYNVHIRGASGRARCAICSSRDHFASICPKRSFQASSFRAASSSPSVRPRSNPLSSNVPFLDPQLAALSAQSAEFCRKFNYQQCHFPSCRRIHWCIKCNLPHPASQ